MAMKRLVALSLNPGTQQNKTNGKSECSHLETAARCLMAVVNLRRASISSPSSLGRYVLRTMVVREW